MRLWIGFLTVLALIFYVEKSRPECSMADMIGVEWLECVTHLNLPFWRPEDKIISYKTAPLTQETVQSACPLPPDPTAASESKMPALKADALGFGTDTPCSGRTDPWFW